MKHLGSDKFDTFSAGTRPTGINPMAIYVMSEIGIDISGQRSKSINEFSGEKFDYVITLCDNARQNCPVFPGGYKLHWNIEDPVRIGTETEEEKLIVFRKVRNQIKENILKFLNLPRDKAHLKCPECGHIQEIVIPRTSCLCLYKCSYCSRTISPLPPSCCVICAYSDKNCPYCHG